MFYSSLLTREESGVLKGLLILLIVLGHNSLIMGKCGLFPYLYSFHVYCFYIFPFAYGVQEIPETGKVRWLISRSRKNICRFYPLYILWSMIGCAAGVISGKIVWNVKGVIQALLMGNEGLLAQYCGFALLWFLPTIVAVMFWRDLYFCSGKIGKCLILIVSLTLWGASACGLTNFHDFGMFAPFAFFQGVFFAASGIIVRFLLESWKPSNFSRLYAVLLLGCGLSFVYVRGFLPESCTWLTWLIVPILVFSALYQFRGLLVKISFLHLTGRYSLQIYLLHSFVFNVLLLLVPWKNFYMGIVIYLITLGICLGIACIMQKSLLKRILFV